MRKITNSELNRPSAELFATMQRIPVVVVLDNVRSAQNIGAFFRTGDAFAIEKVMLCGITATPPSRDIHKSALGAELTVGWEYYPTTAECVAALKAEGYRIVATTPHRQSCTPESFDVAKAPFCLVFGTEHAGVSDEIIEAADEYLRIPMCGMVESLNVSASAAILIYMLSQRMRLECDSWHLSDEKRTRTLYDWYRYAVRDSEALLERKYSTK